MPKYKVIFTKIATIMLAFSFFVQLLTVVFMVFLQSLSAKLGISHLLFEVHEYNGFIFAALVLAHIYLNWWWVKANILKRRAG